MKKIAFILLSLFLFSESAFTQIVNFGHTQHSGRNTASFGVLRSDYDNFTDFFYWNSIALEKDLYPTVYGATDENYWNVGASAKYGNLKASLIFYEQISAYKDWPSNMTDLGLAFNIGFNESLTFQGRYYDFCYSGGKGTAMPGGTVALVLGEGEFKHRMAASLDWCFWFLGPWDADVMFARTSFKYDYSKDASNGFGLGYRFAPPMEGTGNESDVSEIATSHTFSIWAGAAKDIDEFTVGIRPDAYITLNAVNPTDLPTNKEGKKEDYNPFARDGNTEFHITLPVCISYHVTEKVEVVASVFFGLYYANSNRKLVPEAAGALDKFKYEVASEVGVNLKNGYNGDISSRDAGKIGGNMVRKMIERAEKNITLCNIERIAKGLNVPIIELLSENGND